MTEGEWLACADPTRMWGWLDRTGRFDQRRCGYVLRACLELSREGKLRPQASDDWEDTPGPDAHLDPISLQDVARHTFGATAGAHYSGSEKAELVAVLRDVFGNPFRPVTFDPAWRTPAALSLARAAEAELSLFESRLEPVRLLVLADALEEAGCTDEAILTHLRSKAPHVSGCWVLGLILGEQ
jgi:hypothetical protein